MKSLLKGILFLAFLTLLDFLLRKGLIAFFIPFQLPQNLNVLLLFTLFAAFSWWITKRFAQTDQTHLSDLGISFNRNNRLEFLYGLFIGVALWAVVSLAQSYVAGFSWTIRPDFNATNLIHGLIFIFVADLGTELYTRGYPLTKFKDRFGAIAATAIMVLFVGLKSISFDVQGELLFYTILIPALHTVFFSFIYFKTQRLGGPLGVHTGANLVTISIFDLRVMQPNQAIPSGIFQPDTSVETLSLTALQLPWILMATALSIVTYLWWSHNRQPRF